jgi:hypothetical protein
VDAVRPVVLALVGHDGVLSPRQPAKLVIAIEDAVPRVLGYTPFVVPTLGGGGVEDRRGRLEAGTGVT